MKGVNGEILKNVTVFIENKLGDILECGKILILGGLITQCHARTLSCLRSALDYSRFIHNDTAEELLNITLKTA